MNYKDTSKENIDNHIDRIIDVVDEIELGKVNILTGGNTSGKSVIRKLLPSALAKRLGYDAKRANYIVASTSMQFRTSGSSNESIIESGMGRMTADLPWLSTSEQTLDLVEGLMKNCIKDGEDESKKRFVVIDELEIGMSKEVQLGACIWLNELLKENMDKLLGVLIITHSDVVVKGINHDKFISIDGMTEDEWINREIVPVNPKDLDAWASALYKGIRDRERRN